MKRWVSALAAGTKRNMLKLLSKADMSPSEIAQKLGLSVSNVTQQLSAMESLGLVKISGIKKGKTRAFKLYTIGSGFAHISSIQKDEFIDIEICMDASKRATMNIWKLPQTEFHYFIERFFWEIQDKISDIDAIAVYGSVARGDARKNSDIDILVLVNKNFKKHEKELTSFFYKNPSGQSATIMCQVFECGDFLNSVESKSAFAKNALNDAVMIYDPKNIFGGIR